MFWALCFPMQVVELSRIFHNHVKDDDFRLVKERLNETPKEHIRLMEKIKWRTYCLAAVGELVTR